MKIIPVRGHERGVRAVPEIDQPGSRPPPERRGVMLIDPPYEVKDDYTRLPRIIEQVHRKWNVGIILLWYPILTTGAHLPMLTALTAANRLALKHQPMPPQQQGNGTQRHQQIAAKQKAGGRDDMHDQFLDGEVGAPDQNQCQRHPQRLALPQ